MRIREARIRDAAAIAGMMSENEEISVDAVMGMIQKNDPKIYVGADFSANILACSVGADKVYKSKNCFDQNVEEEFRKMY
ncbi:MAG: hypothetical protein KBS96_08210 [Lachnospiraceae bacterium]|nr:hypothetical protein [Candidatus Colinaster scatohippi]